MGEIISFVIPLGILVCIVLTRKVILSMVLGIVVGGVSLHWGEFVGLLHYFYYRFASVFYSFGTHTFKSNTLYLFAFLLLLGVFSRLLLVSGAVEKFEFWATQRVKTQKRAELLVFFTGMIVFLNGYFSAIVSGGIAKPLSKYSNPQRMAYIIDSTAVPVCVLIPISSWGAYILGLLGENLPHSTLFIDFSGAIMQSFYAWFALVAVFLSIVWNVNFGEMQKYQVQKTPLKSCSNISSHSSLGSILVPIVGLIVVSIAMIVGIGVYHSSSWNIWEVLSNTNMVFALFCGVVGAIILLIIRERIQTREILSSFIEGSKEMIPLLFVLLLAWVVGSMIKEDFRSGVYLSQMLSFIAPEWQWILPAGIFFVSALVAFSTGSGGGSLAIMIPLSLDLATQSDLGVSLVLSAVISGAIYGDHASPISDTTIISASSAGCSLQSHFSTQFPYATLVAFCSLVGFLVEGMSGNLIVAFAISFALLVGVLFVLKNKQAFR